jgi:multidrug efflux pump subunit AcrB
MQLQVPCIIGSMVVLFDPIFHRLAISLGRGVVLSTILTLVVVPVVYYIVKKIRITLQEEIV